MKQVAFGLALLLTAYGAQAQLFTSCTRNKYKPSVQRQATEQAQKQELPWVTLVKEAEKAQKCPPPVKFKVEPAPSDKGVLFNRRKFLIQQGIASNDILKGYEVIVPRPTDLTSVYQSDIDSVEVFFKQGTTWDKVLSSFKNQSARKYQEGMVEIRFRPQASENTFIFLIDVLHMRIYIFLNKYKNKI
ncbi:MAG: hypothetical protein J5601_03560 [Elusimicrobiaceae bacterium]|nr:hypothetical protein [Elusimicrobiaceae bacterium]